MRHGRRRCICRDSTNVSATVTRSHFMCTLHLTSFHTLHPCRCGLSRICYVGCIPSHPCSINNTLSRRSCRVRKYALREGRDVLYVCVYSTWCTDVGHLFESIDIVITPRHSRSLGLRGQLRAAK